MQDLKLRWGMSKGEVKKILPNIRFDDPIGHKATVKVSFQDDKGNVEDFGTSDGEMGGCPCKHSLHFRNGKLNSILTDLRDVGPQSVLVSYEAVKKTLVQQFGQPSRDLENDHREEFEADNDYGEAVAQGKLSLLMAWDNLKDTQVYFQVGGRNGEVTAKVQIWKKQQQSR